MSVLGIQGDRFIPNRSLMNLDQAHGFLTSKNEEYNSSKSKVSSFFPYKFTSQICIKISKLLEIHYSDRWLLTWNPLGSQDFCLLVGNDMDIFARVIALGFLFYLRLCFVFVIGRVSTETGREFYLGF